MIRASDGQLTILLTDAEDSRVSAEDFSLVLLASGRLYRLIRAVQFAEQFKVSWKEFTHYQTALGEWFANPSSASAARLMPPTPREIGWEPATEGLSFSTPRAFIYPSLRPAMFVAATNWVGSLRVKQANEGSLEAVILALGAGTGVGAAAVGLAKALSMMVQVPGQARESWARGKERTAKARLAETAADTAGEKFEAVSWSSRVIRGEIVASPEQLRIAIEIQAEAGVIGKQFANRIDRELSADVEDLAVLAEAGKLKAD